MQEIVIWLDHPTLPIKVSSVGHILSKLTGKFRNPSTGNGYACIDISRKEKYVHRLVAETFLKIKKNV